MFGRGIGSKTVGGASSDVRRRLIPHGELDRARPVWLVDISPLGGGPELHFSEINVVVQGVRYEDYINELTGLGSELSRLDATGGGKDVSIEVDNSALRTYGYLSEMSDTYPLEGAPLTVRLAFLDTEDGSLLEAVEVFTGTVEEISAVALSALTVSARSGEFKGDL